MSPPVGLLGGSFDPIHSGHLQLARDALRELRLAQVRFVPAAQPWQKPAMTDALHRAQMVQLAIASEQRFVLDMHEIERGGPTYTVDTLRELRSAAGRDAPLVWIMGGDQFERLETWREWRSIPTLAHLGVSQRAGRAFELTQTLSELVADCRCEVAQLSARACGCIVQFTMTPTDVSATEVRRLLRESDSPATSARLDAALPRAVLDYIRKHHLYR